MPDAPAGHRWRASARGARPTLAVLGATAVGGALGTAARWLLVAPTPPIASSPWPVPGEMPDAGPHLALWLTLGAVNLTGSFLLGWLTGASRRNAWPRWLVTGLGVGALGAYTSLSAVLVAVQAALVTVMAGTGTLLGWAMVVTVVLAALVLAAAAGTLTALLGLRLGQGEGTSA